MGLDTIVQWTKSKLGFRDGGSELAVVPQAPMYPSGRTAQPALDVFESRAEVTLVLDAPGATPRNTRITWDGVDTLTVYVQRASPAPGEVVWWEQEACDWFRQVALGTDLDGAKASSTVLDGVVTVVLPKRGRSATGKLIPVRAG